MFNQFAPDAKHQPEVPLIPDNVLAFAIVTVQAIGHGKETGGRNAKLELTINGGPFERRKIWHYLGDPSDSKNSEKYQQMSLAAMQHMLEAAGVFRVDQPATYQQFANADFTAIMQVLDGKTVAIKIKTDKGDGTFAPKNVVGDWLSPNPSSRTNGKWKDLLAGNVMPANAAAVAPQGQQPMFAIGGAQQVGQQAAAAGQIAPQQQQQQQQPAAAPAVGGAPSWLTGAK